LLVTFSPDAEWSLLDHIAMEEELSAIFGRKVDLVSRRAIERSENYLRRKAILETAQPYYVAR
jgi:predicted nucleotidyltransferase